VRKSGGDARPNYSSIEGYVAAKVLAEGLKRAGRNPSRDSVVSALESIQNTNFGGFHVNIGPKLHVASHYVDLSMLTEDAKVRR
jgi:branched-chain amino acid transport system substrate-binding protein